MQFSSSGASGGIHSRYNEQMGGCGVHTGLWGSDGSDSQGVDGETNARCRHSSRCCATCLSAFWTLWMASGQTLSTIQEAQEAAYDASRASCQSLQTWTMTTFWANAITSGSPFRMKLGLVVKVYFIARTKCPGDDGSWSWLSCSDACFRLLTLNILDIL